VIDPVVTLAKKDGEQAGASPVNECERDTFVVVEGLPAEVASRRQRHPLRTAGWARGSDERVADSAHRGRGLLAAAAASTEQSMLADRRWYHVVPSSPAEPPGHTNGVIGRKPLQQRRTLNAGW
jgi:hypothetical protein